MASNRLEGCLDTPTKNIDLLKWNLCLFCLKKDYCKLSKGSQDGSKNVIACAQERNCNISLRIKDLECDLVDKPVIWHKSCYAPFTSKRNISVGKKRHIEETCSHGTVRRTKFIQAHKIINRLW